MERVNIRDQRQWIDWARRARYRSSPLASLLGVSARQLHRYMRALFGRSPQAWLDEQRLAQAATLLPRLRSVKMVSYELGFKQVSHFSREFKRRYGIPPTEFVKRRDAEMATGPSQITNGHEG